MPEALRSTVSVRRERTLLVGLREPAARQGGVGMSGLLSFRRQADAEERLVELRRLAETAGAQVVAAVSLRHPRVHPDTFIGWGQVERLARMVAENDIDVVIFDTDLAPAQTHNLEERFQCKVIDRSELILDIFATRARTRMAKLQVELAQLEYIYPRLRRMWTHLERQAGGIGVRGPGEQQLESDRRIARRRIIDLRRQIAHIQSRRAREVRARRREFTVSLVGYTNAGKSTLMNALTGAKVQVGDRLFCTLDTRTRRWVLDGNHTVLLSDTVGFIRDLPHHLVASFLATLEEARQARLLLHVADVSHPQVLEQVEVVRQVLEEVGCGDRPTLLVLNKIDAVTDDTALRVLTREEPATVVISALTGQGLDELTRWVAERLLEEEVEVRVQVPLTAGRLLSHLAAAGHILRRATSDGAVLLTLRLPRGQLARIRKHFPELVLLDQDPRGEVPDAPHPGEDWPDDPPSRSSAPVDLNP